MEETLKSLSAPAELNESDTVPRAEFHSVNIGMQSLVLGDCLTELATYPDRSFDLVITSPPYNLGVRYGAYDDAGPRAEYLAWMALVAGELFRVLTDNGSIFLNVGSSATDPWVSHDIAFIFRERFTLQNNIVWVKSISIGEDTVGHFKPINSDRYLNHNHESIFHFTKSGRVPIDRLSVGVPFKDKSNISRWGHSNDRRCAGNTWYIPYRTIRSKAEKYNHPAGFPIDIPERCIRLHGDLGARILDPFMGTGTTLVAAQRLGHSGVGMEIDATYVEAVIERLAEDAGL